MSSAVNMLILFEYKILSTPVVPSEFMITETGNNMITETTLENMVTEGA